MSGSTNVTTLPNSTVLTALGYTPRDQELLAILLQFDPTTPKDQDVVGLGALIGFIAAGGLTQIFSILLHRLKDCKSHSMRPGTATKTHITYRTAKALAPSIVDEPVQFWINIISALLIGLSDQQVVMGVLFLAIIIGTKGESFSLYFAQFTSFFTLITHAAAIVSMKPYFRKYPKMTLIRVVVMLLGYCIWLFANGVSFSVMNEILATKWYAKVEDPTLVKMHDDLKTTFIYEFALMTWVYSSMVPSLFIPESLLKVRKAVAAWPLKKGSVDDDLIRAWIHRYDNQPLPDSKRKLIRRRLSQILLWPGSLFCRLLIHTKSRPLRAFLWLIAEILNPWAVLPFVLLTLFAASLVVVVQIGREFRKVTEWGFGQILPIAVVFLPFWALVQAYAEDWQATIDEKKAALQETSKFGSDGKMSKEKQYMLNNDITVDPVDGESITAQNKHRDTIFRD